MTITQKSRLDLTWQPAWNAVISEVLTMLRILIGTLVASVGLLPIVRGSPNEYTLGPLLPGGLFSIGVLLESTAGFDMLMTTVIGNMILAVLGRIKGGPSAKSWGFMARTLICVFALRYFIMRLSAVIVLPSLPPIITVFFYGWIAGIGIGIVTWGNSNKACTGGVELASNILSALVEKEGAKRKINLGIDAVLLVACFGFSVLSVEGVLYSIVLIAVIYASASATDKLITSCNFNDLIKFCEREIAVSVFIPFGLRRLRGPIYFWRCVCERLKKKVHTQSYKAHQYASSPTAVI